MGRSARVDLGSVAEAEPAVMAELPRYAGSGACRACHEAEYETWHDTYHRTMTQRPGEDSMLGAFDGRALGPRGLHRVGADRNGWWVEQPGPEGEPVRRPVELVTGSHHMQVYWTKPRADDGRLEAFDWAWLVQEGRWVPNEATLLRPPPELADGRHPTTFTWNRVCIKCHVVSGSPGYDEDADHVRSTVAELGIACEACHGPAGGHVRRYGSPIARYLARFDDTPDPTIVHPGRLRGDDASQICGQCHSITVFHDDDEWVRNGHDAAPPDPIAAWGTLVRHPVAAAQPQTDALLQDDPDFFADRFWTDGMVRVSGREYNGIVESPCAADERFGCLSCHSLHGSDPDDQLLVTPEQGRNAMCSDCHAQLAADVQAHSHHLPQSEGSRCENCHMPHTTYGLLKAMRSHHIDSPNIEATLATGRPNACNLCHLDRSLQWTAEHLEQWYGQQPPSEPLQGDVAASLTWLLSGDAGQRALAAWHLGWQPALQASDAWWAPLALAEVLDDPYAAVRLVAARALRSDPALRDLPVEPLFDPQAAQQVLGRLPDRAGPTAPAVPTSNGRLEPALVKRLRASRDDRPVALAE